MSEKFQAISDKVSENFCLVVTLRWFCSTQIFLQYFSAINSKPTDVTVSFDIYSDTFLHVHIYCNAREQKSFLCITIYGKNKYFREKRQYKIFTFFGMITWSALFVELRTHKIS